MQSPAVGLASRACFETQSNSRHPARPYRHSLRSLTYVRLDSGDGCILRDVSELGIAMHGVGTFVPDQRLHLQFELANPRLRIETAGCVAWTDSLGRSGIEFIDLPSRLRRSIQEWVLTQVFAGAGQASPSDQGLRGAREPASGLLFSAASRPVIRLDLPKLALPKVELPPVEVKITDKVAPNIEPVPGLSAEAEFGRVRLFWYPFAISARSLARLLDGLVLLCGVLLFAVMAMAITSQLPSWPLATGLVVFVGILIAALYWLLFPFCMGASPGHNLAQVAFTGSPRHSLESLPPRAAARSTIELAQRSPMQ